MKEQNPSRSPTHPVAAVLSKLDSANDLLVDKVGGHLVVGGLVPRREDLFSEEEPPGRVPLLGSLFLGVLLALRHGVHHVVAAAAQRGNLEDQGAMENGS